MGIKVATDVFQEAMGSLLLDMEGVVVYLDDILILEATTSKQHLKVVEEVLCRLDKMGMQVIGKNLKLNI